MIGNRVREKPQPLLIITRIKRSGAFNKDLEGKLGDKTLKFVLRGVDTTFYTLYDSGSHSPMMLKL